MKNKVLLIGGAVGLGAAWYFWRMSTNQTSNATQASANPQLITQPSQAYPYTTQPQVRQDNVSQPWYNGNQSVVGAKVPAMGDTNFAQNVAYVQGFSDITESVASMWDTLGGLFGSRSSPEVASNYEDTSSVDWSNLLSFGNA